MPTSTYKTFLMHKKAEGTYECLFPVKTVPALGAAPSTLDATTLSDPMKCYIPDISDVGMLEFSANYEEEYLNTVESFKGKTESWAVWYGGTEANGIVTPTGDDGKWEFDGQIVAWPKEAQVSAVRELGIGIFPSTPVKHVTE